MRLSRAVAVVLLCGCSAPVKPVLLTGRVLLPGGPVDGEVLVDDRGSIACAATSCASVKGYASAVRLDLGDAVISPGLINAHDHSDYETVAPQAHGDVRYAHRHDWRVGAEGAAPLPTVPPTTDRATIVAAELRGVLGGATSVLSSGGSRGLARNLASADSADREGLTARGVVFDTFPLGDQAGTLLESGCGYPRVTTAAHAFSSGAYAPHIGEGINAASHHELECLTELISARTAVIHGVSFDPRDVAALASAGSSLIWSPRSNLSLYGDTASATVFHAANVPIALGTDWIASGSMNLLRELACADQFNAAQLSHAFSDAALWEMATANGAHASGFEAELGTLEAGKAADVTVFAPRRGADYRAVIAAGVEDVRLVLRGGHPLAGDADLVGRLQSGCAPLDVCGHQRLVCLDDTGVTLAEVKAAADRTYPLFFCGDAAPDGEHSCVPYRDDYPAGFTALDRDGDGIADAADDCPAVFNPLRPGAAAQADADGDGFGDACDAAPLDALTH
jgi:hypothetical protein